MEKTLNNKDIDILHKKMNPEEKPLSEKQWESTDHGLGEEVMSFWKSDVKEAVERLKEDTIERRDGYFEGSPGRFHLNWFIKKIDKIFGEFK